MLARLRRRCNRGRWRRRRCRGLRVRESSRRRLSARVSHHLISSARHAGMGRRLWEQRLPLRRPARAAGYPRRPAAWPAAAALCRRRPVGRTRWRRRFCGVSRQCAPLESRGYDICCFSKINARTASRGRTPKQAVPKHGCLARLTNFESCGRARLWLDLRLYNAPEPLHAHSSACFDVGRSLSQLRR
jgi:hypothetical protein